MSLCWGTPSDSSANRINLYFAHRVKEVKVDRAEYELKRA